MCVCVYVCVCCVCVYMCMCVGCLGEAYSNYDCETSATAKSRPSFRLVYIQCIMTCGVSDLFIHEFCCTCTEELY